MFDLAELKQAKAKLEGKLAKPEPCFYESSPNGDRKGTYCPDESLKHCTKEEQHYIRDWVMFARVSKMGKDRKVSVAIRKVNDLIEVAEALAL